MNPEAMSPHGKALLDYHLGTASARIRTIRDDNFSFDLPVATFFRDAESYELERIALNLCNGKILDAGAGTGIHSLFLQKKGFDVLAIDIIPEAIRVMGERGISKIKQADIMTYEGNQFDTILMLGHGIGMVEDIAGLDKFLRHIRKLLTPAGQVVLTTLDVRKTDDPVHLNYQKLNADTGKYFGEIRMQFEYNGITGPMFSWLHVDAETLENHAEQRGWKLEVIDRQDDGNYLARLTNP